MARVTSQRKPSKKKEKKERNAGVAVRFGSQVSGQTDILHPDKLGWPWCWRTDGFIALRKGDGRVLLEIKRCVLFIFLCMRGLVAPPPQRWLFEEDGWVNDRRAREVKR